MAIQFLNAVDLATNELQNATIQNLATAPSSPGEGRLFYNSTAGVKSIQFWNGTAWVSVDPTLATGIPLSAIASIATHTLIGNSTAGAATPTALTTSAVKSMLAIVPADVSGFDTQVRTSTLNQMAAPTAALSVNGQKVTNLGTPTATTDAATKAYVDATAQSAASGIDPKDAVNAATTANITLSGTQTIDGVSVAVGDRVLVKDQTTASANGIYVCASGAWTRATDAVQGTLTSGALVLALGGSTNGGTQWYLQTADPITVGTTSLTFAQFGASSTYSAAASGGLSLSGSAFSVKLPASSGLSTSASGLQVDTAIVARKYSTTVGDGSATSITVTHNLGTQDVIVQLRAAATPFDVQYASVKAATTNTVTLEFATAPASNSLRCTVLG